MAPTVLLVIGACAGPGPLRGGGELSLTAAALPGPIDGIEPEAHGYVAPIVDSNGNLYRITESLLAENNQPKMMKSTDGGATWAEVDAANRPGTSTGSGGDLESGWLTWDARGKVATFTWQRSSSQSAYASFRTSDHATQPDTWISNTREIVASVTGSPQYMSHTSPTDQPYEWLFYNNSSTNPVYRSRSGPGSYGPQTPIDSSGGQPAAMLDSDNVTHIVYVKSSQLHYKTLSSSGTLSATSTRVDANGISSEPIPHAAPVVYKIGGDSYVGVLFANASGHLKFVPITNGTPGAEETITTSPVMQDPSITTNDGAVVSLAVHGTTLHALWSDAATGDVLHASRPHGGAWSSPTVLVTTGTEQAQYVYGQVYSYRGSTVLGYTFDIGPHVDDDSNIFYNELALDGQQQPPSPVNQAPVVNAGPDQAVTLPASAFLDGTVTDDGLPSGAAVTSTWSTVSGPGTVTFGDANAVDTTASFSTGGSYVLRLTASDSQLTSSDEVTVTVLPSAGGGTQAVEKRVAAGSDDAEQALSGGVSLTSSDLELTTDGSTQQTVGVRFTALQIPAGATITNAYLQFRTDEVSSGTASLTIRTEAADNAPTYARTSGNITSRPTTSASVAWSPPDWPTVGAEGTAQRTPNLAAPVQAVVNRPGWVQGNAMAFQLSGTGRRTAEAFESGASIAPLLHVEYTTG